MKKCTGKLKTAVTILFPWKYCAKKMYVIFNCTLKIYEQCLQACDNLNSSGYVEVSNCTDKRMSFLSLPRSRKCSKVEIQLDFFFNEWRIYIFFRNYIGQIVHLQNPNFLVAHCKDTDRGQSNFVFAGYCNFFFLHNCGMFENISSIAKSGGKF